VRVKTPKIKIKNQILSTSEKNMFAEYYAHNKVYIDHCVSLISIQYCFLSINYRLFGDYF